MTRNFRSERSCVWHVTHGCPCSSGMLQLTIQVYLILRLWGIRRRGALLHMSPSAPALCTVLLGFRYIGCLFGWRRVALILTCILGQIALSCSAIRILPA